MTFGSNRRLLGFLAGLGAFFTAAWAVLYVIPDLREMMLGFVAGFLLNVWATALLWWMAGKATPMRGFWACLAAGWTFNLIGNMAWTAHDAITGSGLPTFSVIDILYVARYALVGAAFWRYPRHAPRRWWHLVAAAVLVTAVIWFVLWRPAQLATMHPFYYFVGLAMYPILDAPLIYLAWLAWRKADVSRPVWGILLLAALCYGLANWINFSVRLETLQASLSAADWFWLLTDGLTGGAVLYALWQGEDAAAFAGE